jgi:hypothetical protein
MIETGSGRRSRDRGEFDEEPVVRPCGALAPPDQTDAAYAAGTGKTIDSRLSKVRQSHEPVRSSIFL